jgi:hypothetical protein
MTSRGQLAVGVLGDVVESPKQSQYNAIYLQT